MGRKKHSVAKRRTAHVSKDKESDKTDDIREKLTSELSREEIISFYHMKEKEIRAVQNDPSIPNEAARSARIQLLKAQQAVLGIDTYQKASISGESKSGGFDSSKWVLSVLQSEECCRFPNRTELRILDVGAIVHRFPRELTLQKPCTRRICLDVTSIDLNPQDAHNRVQKADFFPFAEDHKNSTEQIDYDIVCLCLCVNFVGCSKQRGKMLQLARDIVSDTGMLFLTLPRACVVNSRYVTLELLISMLAKSGWEVVLNKMSAKLVLLVCKACERGTATSEPGIYRKQVQRGGANRNNFAIELPSISSNEGRINSQSQKHGAFMKPKESRKDLTSTRNTKLVGVAKNTSNQRKRARRKALQAAKASVSK